MHRIICGDVCKVLPQLGSFDCIFADPPDNIGNKYSEYADNIPGDDYELLWSEWLRLFAQHSPNIWISFNAKHTLMLARIAEFVVDHHPEMQFKPCVQTFTFGQHNHGDFSNCHRPLWRFRDRSKPIYADAIRERSWRQEHGDSRADPRGKVPGDVFEFPRVTGNSKQRRSWHPNQLHEGLVERCLKSCTIRGDSVLDPFAGTGTTLRVAKRLGLDCTLIDIDRSYCEKIAREHQLTVDALECNV